MTDETSRQTASCPGLCFVRWIDSRSLDAWTEPGECEVAPSTIESVGWIYGETDDTLAIAGSRAGCGQMAGIMIIPKASIQNRVEIVANEDLSEGGELPTLPVRIGNMELRTRNDRLSSAGSRATAEIVIQERGTCLTIAFWRRSELGFDLHFVGSRPFEYGSQRAFWELARTGQAYLEQS